MTHSAHPDRQAAGGDPLSAAPAPLAAAGEWLDVAASPSPAAPVAAPSKQPAPQDRNGDGAPREAGPPVPLMDPPRVYADWGPAAEGTVRDILRSHAYVKGPHVRAFEEEFAAYIGTQHAVAVDSCTDALFLVLRALFETRPPEAREVILPTFTFVATAGAVVNAGGRPVFADVDEDTHNLDPASVAALVGPNTAAVIPVHLFGAPADIPAVRAALGAYASAPATNGNGNGSAAAAGGGVYILEDAAQAIHAHVGGQRAGSLADAGTFSFYPSKNLGAAGDGGVITTDDPAMAASVRALRDHGQTRKLYDHEQVGTNSRMDEIQAAILRIKLPSIGKWTADRRAIAARYDAAFEGTPVRGQAVLPGAESAYHLYTVRIAERDAVAEALGEARIGCGVYYPLPLHRQTCFARYEAASCPRADALAETVLSLPCFPGLTEAEQARVIETVLRAVGA